MPLNPMPGVGLDFPLVSYNASDLRAMQSFEYRSVRKWSKEINGTHTGGGKSFFFYFAAEGAYGL